MLNKQGSTLIETLLAFEIFISVLILYTSLFSTIYGHEAKIKRNYVEIHEEEECLNLENNFTSIIDMVLH